MNKGHSPEADKLWLIHVWSKWFYEHTNTFRGSLGVSLAYLWPAIASGNKIEVSARSRIIQILKENKVDSKASIWDYIDIVG